MGRVYEFGPFPLETPGDASSSPGTRCQVRQSVLDTFCVLVSRSSRSVENDDLTDAIWPDPADNENHLAHFHCSNDFRLPGLELLARRDDPAQSSLVGDTADLTAGTERVGACAQTSQS
jgi:hypothetical protein